MKRILTVLAILALTGGGALAADKILRGDQFVVAGVNFPQPFKTPTGQILKAGLYDLKVVSEGADGILIGLLKGGKQVGQLRGTVKQGGRPYQPAGIVGPIENKGQPAGTVGPIDNKVQPAGGIGPIDNKAFRDLGFTSASAVSFGGGAGKISCQNNLQPGAILPYIEFPFVPAVQNMK